MASKKTGPWHQAPAPSFAAFQKAIKDVLDEQAVGSEWVVEMEVRRRGNPIGDYRIVLSPGN